MAALAERFEEKAEKIFQIDPLYQPMTEHFAILAHVYDLLTSKQRRVLAMFFDMELKHRAGDPKFKDGVFVGLEKISKITDVSERGIQYFLEKFRKDAFLDSLLKIKNRPYSSNLYEMSELLFFFLGYLKVEGALYQWKKHRARILGYVQKSNDIIINRLQLRFEKLSTIVLRPTTPHFCVLLNVFTKFFRICTRTKARTFLSNEEKPKIQITAHQEKVISDRFGDAIIQKAKVDFLTYNGQIRFAFAFFYRLCEIEEQKFLRKQNAA